MNEENYDELMSQIDRKCKFPKHWQEFIKKQHKYHNIIIKDSKQKEFYCTHCNGTFKDKKLKIGDFISCPNCKMNFRIYGANYHRKSFEKSVIFIQRMNKKIIARVFEIYSFFNKGQKEIQRDIVEYARIIPGIGTFLADNVYIKMYGVMRVYHDDPVKWWKYNGCKTFSHFATYPYNKNRLIKGTKFEYAPIKEFQERFFYYNFIETLKIAANESFELLWKLKLYNLSISASKFNKSGSFLKRFGLPKNYLKFMQDNDVDYSELRLLKLFKEENIRLIKRWSGHSYNNVRFLYKNKILQLFDDNYYIYNGTIKQLKELQKFIPLRRLNSYKKGFNNLNIYLDYFKMAEKLALNYKSSKDLYPRNLISRHDKMQKKIKVTEDMQTQFGAYLRFLELSKYMYEDDTYRIFPAPSIDDMKDEGRQQDNCVGSLYVTPYTKGETEIYFIRKLDDITKSFITLEFKDGRIKQKELPHHSRNFSDEQENFIQKWLGYRQFMDKKEKYKVKIVKYDLNKMVA